jgi:ribosomal protein L7Ae-like RNA K-turn-binding protein
MPCVSAQERAHLKDPVKSAMRKRYVCGMREVLRSLKTNKARALVVAHNIEKIEADDGLDALIGQLVNLSEHKLEWVYNEQLRAASQQLVPRENYVPVIFAYTRRNLARALKRQAKTSCVAVLSPDGATDLFDAMLREAKHARQGWHELTSCFPADRERSRRLIMLPHGAGKGKPATVDELQMSAVERRIDDDA